MGQKALRLISIGVFLAGALAIVLAFALSHAKKPRPSEAIKPTGFTMTSKR